MEEVDVSGIVFKPLPFDHQRALLLRKVTRVANK